MRFPRFSYTVTHVRPITQAEAQQMRGMALKTIAGYYDPAVQQDGAQAAANLARGPLESIGLLYEKDAQLPSAGV